MNAVLAIDIVSSYNHNVSLIEYSCNQVLLYVKNFISGSAETVWNLGFRKYHDSIGQIIDLVLILFVPYHT